MTTLPDFPWLQGTIGITRFPGDDPAADELAAAYLIDPSLVTRKETLYLDVQTFFGKTYGSVKFLDHGLAPNATPVEVVFNMDFAKIFELYRRALTAK